jgi:hypothetical protein
LEHVAHGAVSFLNKDVIFAIGTGAMKALRYQNMRQGNSAPLGYIKTIFSLSQLWNKDPIATFCGYPYGTLNFMSAVGNCVFN